ncbi:MAG: hypothetical protein ACTSRP_00775 [Candidatus Helarchaeota archaeon]
MSEDFLNALLKSSSTSIDEKIKTLSSVLDKIMEVVIKSISGLESQINAFEKCLAGFETKVADLESKLDYLESRPKAVVYPSANAPQEKSMGTSAGSPIKAAPSPRSPSSPPAIQAQKPAPSAPPLNPRAALQSELKALFSKMKRK